MVSLLYIFVSKCSRDAFFSVGFLIPEWSDSRFLSSRIDRCCIQYLDSCTNLYIIKHFCISVIPGFFITVIKHGILLGVNGCTRVTRSTIRHCLVPVAVSVLAILFSIRFDIARQPWPSQLYEPLRHALISHHHL